MKRFFILASAAIVALASCAKTQVVYKGEPQEITFKAISGVMTKANLDGNTTMGVYANYASTETDNAYETFFENAVFNDKGSYWGATPAKYWPLEGNLDFVVYSPYTNASGVVAWTYSDSQSKLVIKVDNSTAQLNWLYGKGIANGTKGSTVSTPLRHALAKVTANITSDLADLVVKSVVVTATEQVGTLTVNYAETDNIETPTDERLSWDLEEDDEVEKSLIGNNTLSAGVPVNGTPCYVIPSAQQKLVLTYRLPGMELSAPDLTVDLPVTGEWVENYSYTYNISIGANEIMLNPTVDVWTEEKPDVAPIVPTV